MKPAIQSVCWWLLDKVFPLAQPHSAEEQVTISSKRAAAVEEWNSRTAALPEDRDALEHYLSLCKDALDDEQKRQQSVDARLTTIIGLLTITVSIVFGTILTNMPQTSSALFWLMLLSLVYLITQLVRAIYVSISGLERRTYAKESLSDLLPSRGEEYSTYSRRRLTQFSAILVQNQDENNKKMTQMAVAHCAVRNFITGLIVFAVIACFHQITRQPSDDLLKRFKADQELRELLRGPQGPPGIAGQTGPTGSPGPRADHISVRRPTSSKNHKQKQP